MTLKNRFAATLLVLGLIGLGAAVLFVGFAVLAGLAVTGAVVGTSMSIYNRIRGRKPEVLQPYRQAGLDPSLEVFPQRRELPSSNDSSSA
jgi:multisubunit Na+/H+ antiporter MnhB subunit